MEKIKQQVAIARRRMVFRKFLAVATWSVFATLVIAAIGLAIPKIWVLDVDPVAWMWSWIGGALGVGLLVATVWTYVVRNNAIEAAIEIDRRFQLKERVSSALSLAPDDAESEVGQALMQDAVRRVERIDVREHFPISVNWRALLPVLPALVIFVLAVFVENATQKEPVQAATGTALEKTRVKKSVQKLKERLANAKKKTDDKDLQETDLLLKELQKGIDELASKGDADRKKAMVKINNMAKDLKERRDKLGGADKMRQQLNGLKNIKSGPADKIAQAMKEGDFQKALDELNNLQEKVRDNKLSDEEREQLRQQLDQLKDKLQEMVNNHQQAKRDLEKEIERREKAGDLDGAGKLQRQLDQLNSMNDQMSQMQQMASNLGQCSQCLKDGDAQTAGSRMNELAQQLQDMQDQLDELETLNQVMDEIAMCKDMMNCPQCLGEGCQGCLGQWGQSGGKSDAEGGFGLGEGKGQGARPEERTDTNYYESQVRGNVQAGEAVRTGSAGGPNRAGRSFEEVKEQISSELSEDADPLVDVRLPRKERDHAKEYFQRYNKGE
ncbi:MAG: hypothetical protein H8E44_38675 [Planctomycetes bacterium]|nr:hypothetical protein [Planctomycetota bacterium]MBL7041748.1 hypothetical protein [Pirellulaceae bacterium]